jgi:RNA-directed DNA polymerase
VATDLTRIGQKARKDMRQVFTNLYHHVYDVDNLRACFDSLDANKATGVDGVTKLEYGQGLAENLQELSGRLQRMSFRPGAKRRTYVPKPGSTKGRPLGISNLEDKIVEVSAASDRR